VVSRPRGSAQAFQQSLAHFFLTGKICGARPKAGTLVPVIIQIIRRSHNRFMFTEAMLIVFVETFAQPFTLVSGKEFTSFRVDKANGIFQSCTTHYTSLQ
jgi:hypothetical protein